tara:strand:- start:677 stop:1567 length:891 start_codon:yes stop_codon:yes gene_type:complete
MELHLLSNPIVVSSGQVVSCSYNNYNSVFNGYLVDEDYFAGCGGGGNSSSASSIDSLSQKISKLDSTLFSLISLLNFGCTDSLACNYNPNSDRDDGSCFYGVLGCMDSTAKNYNPNASCDNGFVCDHLRVGDFHEGGIVFYLDTNGGGLVVSDIETAISVPWGCYGRDIYTSRLNVSTNQYSPINSANGVIVGTGYQNTLDVFGNGCLASGDAVDVCYRFNHNGYNDWFLPSKDELSLIYTNLNSFNFFINNFYSGYYWSSTEIDSYQAWIINMSDGTSASGTKNTTRNVRAIRAF